MTSLERQVDLGHSSPTPRVSGPPRDKADRVSALQPRASQSPSLCSTSARGKPVSLVKDVGQNLSSAAPRKRQVQVLWEESSLRTACWCVEQTAGARGGRAGPSQLMSSHQALREPA